MAGDPCGDRAALSAGPSSRSRRAFLSGGSAAVTAVALGACAANKPLREQVRSGGKVTPADVVPLNALLDLELYTIAAYAAGTPLLGSSQAKAAGQQFLAQELAHASQLTDLIRRGRGKPNRRRASYDLGHPKGPADVMALLVRVEQAQLRAYLAALPQLSNTRLRAAVASIFANDAQHLAFLRWQAGQEPAPTARVTGS